MESTKINTENGFYRAFSMGNIEKVNPIEYYKEYELQKEVTILKDLLTVKNPVLASSLSEEFYINFASKNVVSFFANQEKTLIHENYFKLLDCNKKKDQTSLLRGMSINPDELLSLIFKAHSKFGYLYSMYRFENLPKGTENKELPNLFRLKDDKTIEKVGETDLKDGELKNVLEGRKVITSHFFEKDDIWHCFFTTYNSLSGKESWKNGQAHFHYISSAFGVSKEDFIESMRTGNYKATSIHIDLLDYGNQVDEK